MNHLGDTNKMVGDKTIIEWNADVGTRFLTIYPDGSFHINENTPPLYALGELAKAFMKQQERIKRLEEAVEAYRTAYTPDGHVAPHDCFATGPKTGNPIEDLVACPGCWAERKAKEAEL